MDIAINFLGTSHGTPETDRFCSCTVLTVGDRSYCIDCGAPVVALMRHAGLDPRSLQACFVTHLHGDHANCLTELADFINYFCPPEFNPGIYLPQKDAVNALVEWTKIVGGGQLKRPINVNSYETGVIFDDGLVQVEARVSNHLSGIRPAYSFAVKAGEKRILFSGDVSSSLDDLMSHAMGERWNAVILEAAHNHLDKSAEKVRQLDTDLLFVNHYNYRQNEGRFDVMAESCPFECILAYDGLKRKL